MPNPIIFYRPLFLDQNTGFSSGVPDNAILNIAGVVGPMFTVGGRELLFADGTTTGGGTSNIINLQTSYNNSSTAGNPAVITLTPGKDFIVDVPSIPGITFKIDSRTGTVTIGGDLVLSGTHTIVNSTTYQSDHIRLLGQAPSIPALWIGPDVGQNVPTADLIVVSINPGSTTNAALRVDHLGNTTIGTLEVLTTLTVDGLINGVDIGLLNSNFNKHIFVNGTYKHLAQEINISPATLLDLPLGTIRNVQTVLEFLDGSINSIDAQVLGLHEDVDNLQTQIDGINQQEVGEPTGYSHLVESPSNEWVVQHNKNSRSLIFMLFDDSGFLFQPDSAQIVDANTLIINFGSPQTGRVNIIFYKDNLF